MITREEILAFIHDKGLMVVSTLDEAGQPESAVVGFGETADFQLVFGTSRHSRKAQNIMRHENVSVVIGWDAGGTVQYSGTARALTGDEVDRYAEVYFQKSPRARTHRDSPDEQYFLIEPTWIRHTDVSTNPWGITEIQL